LKKGVGKSSWGKKEGGPRKREEPSKVGQNYHAANELKASSGSRRDKGGGKLIQLCRDDGLKEKGGADHVKGHHR